MSNKKQKKVLGRGLDALLNSSDSTKSNKEIQSIPSSLEVDLNKIQVNPNQPRTNFDSNEIKNLTISTWSKKSYKCKIYILDIYFLLKHIWIGAILPFFMIFILLKYNLIYIE